MTRMPDPNPFSPPDGREQAAAGGGLIKDSDTAHFVADVIEVSKTVPVIVDFWAPWCGPCKQLGPLLEKLVGEAGGLVRLVKINIDKNQELAAQLRVQSIPAVFAFKDGRPVDTFSGSQPESQIRAFMQRLYGDAKPPQEEALELAAAALDGGDAAAASAIFRQILEHLPGDPAATAGLIRCALAVGDAAASQRIIESLPEELAAEAPVAAAIAAAELAELGDGAGDVAALREEVARDENGLQARYDLSLALYGNDLPEEAIGELIELVRRDRQWNDEAARKQLVKIFDALGHQHPLTVAARKQLSTVLFS
ncbi:MAG TPA: thioredoxin [Rhodospirillales bacterium]|jgi:putative thioredoxin|nr:thioredoxin [Rhodospirillales bacterium]